MLRQIIKICCLVILVLGGRSAFGFSMLGDYEAWQQPVVSFRVVQFTRVQLGGSRNIGEEYRLNTPSITYGFDSSFLDYFGSNGVRAIDQAFAILNKLPSASKASKELTEFLTDDAQRSVETAAALNLYDLKSATLGLMLEHMGLYGEEHVFDLRSRGVPPGSPPPCTFLYTVIVRNFDPFTYEPSHYVNGTLYTYEVEDYCPAISRADAVEVLVDPTDVYFNAVATLGVNVGSYYINLTRDDFGGLRYLYRKNNYNTEVLPPNAFPLGSASPWTPVDSTSVTNTITSSNSVALRGGVDKVKFRKVNFNSFLGSSFKPFVQTYSLPYVTNSTVVKQTVRRLVSNPDIVFAAADLANPDPTAIPFTNPIADRSIIFATNGVSITSGPGTILPQKIITFNKIGPFFQNSTANFIEDTATKGFLWGSYDGTTNDPIVYPQGTSIRDLEQQVLSH